MDWDKIIVSLQGLFDDFDAGIFIGISAVIYLVIQILRGKAGFNVPWITNLWNKITSKNVKMWILYGLFAVAGGLVTLQSKECTIWIFLKGMLSGIAFGTGVMGTRHAAKTTMESDTAQALKAKVLKIVKKDK